jgi:hypothetical protein
MKRLCAAVFLLAVFVGYSLVPIAQSLTTCGQGIVVRADSAVIIDAWRVYSYMPPPSPERQVSPAATLPVGTPAPSKIVLGESLPDDLRIGIETSDGTVYVPLSAVRSLAIKAPKR